MRKNIWIFDHYATNIYEDKGERYYWFSKFLKERGYNPIIFCSSFLHKGDKNYITDNKKYKIEYLDGVTIIFIRTNKYIGNGIGRIKNMLEYFLNILINYKKIEKVIGKPDVIIGSSVHPLACLAAIIIGKKYAVKKIVEIRDLWPESLVVMNYLKRESFFTRLLYRGEKFLYQKADYIIFSMEGGKQYIIDRGWHNDINLEKVYYINNGVDFQKFQELSMKNIEDDDLLDDKFKIMYTGSISHGSNIKNIIDIAERLKNDEDIKILIYGRGNDVKKMLEYIEKKNLKNIKFKGFVNKQEIPSILKKADILLINISEELVEVCKYGISFNKIFEYLASGRYILQLQKVKHGILKENNCGHVLENEDPVDVIYSIKNMSKEEYIKNKIRQKEIARKYDFKELTNELIKIIEK